MNKSFLYTLLDSMSVSGHEIPLQKKVIAEMTPYCDEIRTDYTGNVICVDEDPAVAAQTLAPITRMVHLKDFYVRHRDPGDSTPFDCAGSWFRSRGGKYLRGAILAQGDLDVYATLAALKCAGYDGNIVVEFEGMEDARYATSVGLNNARRIWNEV